MEKPDTGHLRRKLLLTAKIKNKTLLDLGTGPLAFIAARDFNCSVTSIDISEERIRTVQEEYSDIKLRKKIIFEIRDATNLSYKDNSFDAAIGFAILHHIDPDSRIRLIKEAYRVSKEKIVFADFNTEGFKHIHPDGNYIPVDFRLLETILNNMGAVQKYTDDLMNIYICIKREQL